MTIEALLKKTNLFLLDMDGTLYIDDIPIEAVRETLARLRGAGKRLVYCTNNSSKTPEEYRAKLERIGLWGEGDFVYTSGIAAAEYLKKHYAGKSVYLAGREALKEDFAARGIRLTEEKPDVCVLAYDTALTFEKLVKLNEFLVGGSFYVATHPDVVCPALPCPKPDVGSFIKLLEASSGRLPDAICGKPHTIMGEALSGLLGAEKEEM